MGISSTWAPCTSANMSYTANETYKMTVKAVARNETGSAFDTTAETLKVRPGGHTLAQPLGTGTNAFSGHKATSRTHTGGSLDRLVAAAAICECC